MPQSLGERHSQPKEGPVHLPSGPRVTLALRMDSTILGIRPLRQLPAEATAPGSPTSCPGHFGLVLISECFVFLPSVIHLPYSLAWPSFFSFVLRGSGWGFVGRWISATQGMIRSGTDVMSSILVRYLGTVRVLQEAGAAAHGFMKTSLPNPLTLCAGGRPCLPQSTLEAHRRSV